MAHTTHLVIGEGMDFRTEVEALAAQVKAVRSWRRFAYTDVNGRQTSCIIYQTTDVEPLIRAYEAGEELPVSDMAVAFGAMFGAMFWLFIMRPLGFLILALVVGSLMKLGLERMNGQNTFDLQFSWWSWFAGIIVVAFYRYFKTE